MLAEPNTESPANVDAAKMWREDKWVWNQKIYIKSRYISTVKINLHFRAQFKKRACASVRKSLDMAWSLDSNHLHSCLHLHNCAILYTCTPTKLAPLNFSHSRTDAEKVQCDDHFQFSLYDESAFFATSHHCRACTRSSSCLSLWGGRSSRSSAPTR